MNLSFRKGEKESKKECGIWQLCKAHAAGALMRLLFQNLLRHNRDANGSSSLSCVVFGMPRRLHVRIKDLEDPWRQLSHGLLLLLYAQVFLKPLPKVPCLTNRRGLGRRKSWSAL